MKKGISLLALIIAMAILIVLMSTITIAGFGTLNNSKKIMFATEIQMVQEAVNSYRENNQGNFPTNAEVQIDLSGVTDKVISQFDGEAINMQSVILSKIDYSLIGITTLKYGSGASGEIDAYMVSKTTGKVYYAKGMKVASMTYYTLTSDLKDLLGAKETTDDIKFIVSEKDWTNEDVETIVKVPNNFTNVNVSATNGRSSYIGTALADEPYVKYTIADIITNYIIKVTYTYNEKEYTKEFTVSNIDKDAPVIDTTKIKENVVKNADGTKLQILLNGITDDKSGIKEIKYAPMFLEGTSEEIAGYFKTSGYVVEKNTIEVKDTTKELTIFVEDKAGNFSATFYSMTDSAHNAVIVSNNSGIVTPAMIKSNPESFYGKTVTGYIAPCSDADKEWQIFHSDGEHIYLISKDYLDYNNLNNVDDNNEMPNMPNGQVVGQHGFSSTNCKDGIGLGNTYSYYSGSSDITVENPVYNKISYISIYPSSTTTGIKATAFMVDQKVWNKYIGSKAEYAVGGPTLEQFVDSYNSVSHAAGKEKIYWQVERDGYQVSFDSNNFEVQSTGYAYNSVVIDYDYNEMYRKNTDLSIDGYRLASPCTVYTSMTNIVRLAGHVGNVWHSESSYSFRPLVCLKSGVSLKISSDRFVIE